MPTINQLPLLSQVSAGDQIPVYTPNNGDARRMPISQLLSYFQTSFASPTLATNLYVPGTGFNITVPTPVSEQQWMLLQPAGTLASGTITLPLNTGVPDGTTVLITTTQEIASLTIALNGASAIYGAVTSLGAGTGTIIRFYQATNSWYNINLTTIYAAGIQGWLTNPSSANLRTAMTDETGTGLLVFNTSPTLVTPTLGVATATSVNKLAITTPATGSTLTVADGKTLTASNTLTFTGTDASSVAFGAGGTVAYTADKLSVFAATTSAELAGVISDETGSGSLVFATSPTLVTPVIGAATGTSLTTTGSQLISGTGKQGYATGAGGGVLQATSKSTGVTLNKSCGQITMDAANLAADTTVSFTLTNSVIEAGDIIVMNHISGGTLGSYTLNASCAAGTAQINLRNITTGALAEAVIIRFAVVKVVDA